MPFARRKFFHCFRERNVFDPFDIRVFAVLYLIHNVDCVPVIVKYRLVEGHRFLYGFQSHHHILSLCVHSLCDFRNRRFAQKLSCQLFLGLKCFVCKISHRP